jgi:hypothetical protein
MLPACCRDQHLGIAHVPTSSRGCHIICQKVAFECPRTPVFVSVKGAPLTWLLRGAIQESCEISFCVSQRFSGKEGNLSQGDSGGVIKEQPAQKTE